MRSVVTCPECQFEWNHILSMQYSYNNDSCRIVKQIAVDDDGSIHKRECDFFTELRGNYVEIFFDGECGHRWSIRYTFHKGNIFLTTTLIPRRQQQEKQDEYREYLKSDKWKQKATRKRKQAGNKCQLCNKGTLTLHVHHRTYENIYKEKLADLIVLCEKCHEKFHGIRPTP